MNDSNPKATRKGEAMRAARDEDAGTFDRSFRVAVVVYAVAEFFAVALLLYYKLAR
jgi:hypothetical protein